MAKEKRTAADLDAELAALEAELAALEGKKKKGKEKPAPKPTPAPAPEAPAATPPRAEPEPPAPLEKKSKFGMPKFGKKKAEPAPEPKPEPAPEVVLAPVAAPAPAPPIAPPPARVQERYDASVWRQDGDAWVRSVPETPVPVVRRVLDENGNVVREEPARSADVEEVSGVKAERGVGKLFRRK